MIRSQHYPRNIKFDGLTDQDFIAFNKVFRAVNNSFKTDLIDVFIVKDGVILSHPTKEKLFVKIYPSGDKELGMVRK